MRNILLPLVLMAGAGLTVHAGKPVTHRLRVAASSLKQGTVEVVVPRKHLKEPRFYVNNKLSVATQLNDSTYSLCIQNPIAWSDSVRALHSINVVAKGESASAIFGMREVREEGGLCLINGNRFYVRAIDSHCAAPTAAALRQLTGQQWEAFIVRAKKHGINALCVQADCLSDELLDATDRGSMPVIVRPADEASATDAKRKKNRPILTPMQLLGLRYGNHPSLMLVESTDKAEGGRLPVRLSMADVSTLGNLRTNHLDKLQREGIQLITIPQVEGVAQLREMVEQVLKTPRMAGYVLSQMPDETEAPICTQTAMMADFDKQEWTNKENFQADILVANYTDYPITGQSVSWQLTDGAKMVYAQGSLGATTMPAGRLTMIDQAFSPLAGLPAGKQLRFTVKIEGTPFERSWDIRLK